MLHSSEYYWYNRGIDGSDDGCWSIQENSNPVANSCLKELINPAARIHSLLTGATHFWDVDGERHMLSIEERSKPSGAQLVKRVTELCQAGKAIVISGVYHQATNSLQLRIEQGGCHLGTVDIVFKHGLLK